MKKIIFLDAGHSINSPGAITKYGKEHDFNCRIRDELNTELKNQGFETFCVPDNIEWLEITKLINSYALKLDDGFALSIHCNCDAKQQGTMTGAEVFHYPGDTESKALAKKIIDAYCNETEFKNRGAKPDTQTAVGSLWFIRKLKCWSLLIECGFIDNENDVEKLKDYKKIARGICKGICAIYEISYKEIGESKCPECLKKEQENEALKEINKVLKGKVEDFKDKTIEFVKNL